MKRFLATVATAAVVALGAQSASAAAIIGLQVEGGSNPQPIFELSNGNLLGLFGFDNREGANPGAGAIDINSAADITQGFTSGASSIVNYYNGTNPINPGASEFDVLEFGFTVADNARLFDSLWIEWTGGQLVYQRPSGGTSTSGTRPTLDGDPLAPIPVPPALAALALGLAGLGLYRRRKVA